MNDDQQWMRSVRNPRPNTREEFDALFDVRVSSGGYGPCYSRKLVRGNRLTCTVAYWNRSCVACSLVSYLSVHVKPCPACTDHPKTMYPNGYDG